MTKKINLRNEMHIAIFILGIFVSSMSYSQCVQNSTPTSSCDSLIIDTGITSPLTINSSVQIGGGNAITVDEVGSLSLLQNYGAIGLGANSIGLYNKGVIDRLDNFGTLAGVIAVSNNNPSYASYAQITNLINAGTIEGSNGSGGVGIKNYGYGSIESIQNSGTIRGRTAIDNTTTLGNYGYIGTISNSGGGANITGTGSVAISNSGIIDYINNSNAALITASSSAIQNSGQLGQINNSSSIVGSSSKGILNSSGASISSINNSGSIYGATNAISNTSGGTIESITNTSLVGSATSGIWGNGGVDIVNAGTITKLSNAQNNLVFEGNLPSGYNVIIGGASTYGKTTFFNPVGASAFGVQQAANQSIPLGTTSYLSVLNGLADSNISTSTRAGSFAGAFNNISWTLSQAGTSQIWNLNTTASPFTQIAINGSSAATNLAAVISSSANLAAPVTNVGSTTTTSTSSATSSATGSTTTTQVSTYTFTPTTTAQPTTTTTTTTTSTTVGGVTTVSAPVTTTASAPTVVPASVPTTSTVTTQTVVTVPTTTAQQTTTTTTTSNSTTQSLVGPVLANGTPLAAAAQVLTAAQATQLTQVHAEGYSSNMTIGLEQMAHITNTVMDRIHAPMSSSSTTKVYQDDEGRYLWADAAAVKGTVNNYNNLSGFGYSLYDLIIGGDIKRTKDGGYGVFAGTGTTSMTESQQVTQNFNTTNFYTGLYGAYNFTKQVKLSGALGYMYGNTNASRNTPSVGQFTGGNATSAYKTNGVYAAAKLAKAYQFSDVTVSPFVGASYSQLWMGGASEQGGNDFNFGINSATAYTAVTFAGADFVYPLLKGINNPLSLIGFYKLGYDWYANSNSAHSITATSPTYGSFTQVGANMGPVSNMFGLGIQGGLSKDISARIGVVASTNSYGQEYGGGAELRVKF